MSSDKHQTATSVVAMSEAVVFVRIHERLDEKQRKTLVMALERNAAIVFAMFVHSRHHLMLVRYDMDQYSSQDVLEALKAQKINATLFGTI